jgi:hypothetical protein
VGNPAAASSSATLPRMPIPDDIRDELETVRQRFLRLLVPLQTPEFEGGDTPADPERLRLALWTAVKALDPLLADAQVPPDVDLTSDDPDVQQILRSFVVREYFSLHLLDDPGDVHVPTHTPESCDLRVAFLYGRWFVTWLKLQGEPRTEREARVVLVFEKDQNGRFVFTEV